VRSLCEDEEHLLTFYAFPPVMHRYIRSTNASESLWSLVRQRTDQIDAFTRRVQLSHDCLGRDAGYPPTKDPSRLTVHCSLSSVYQQPTEKGGVRGDIVCPSSWVTPEAPTEVGKEK
jgi:hypothetical protein